MHDTGDIGDNCIDYVPFFVLFNHCFMFNHWNSLVCKTLSDTK